MNLSRRNFLKATCALPALAVMPEILIEEPVMLAKWRGYVKIVVANPEWRGMIFTDGTHNFDDGRIRMIT